MAAAASLQRVMPELVKAFHSRRPGVSITVTYGGSGALRRQVEMGAPIDLVFLAQPAPVDRLIEKGLADPATRVVFATNELVLVGPRNAPALTFDDLDMLKPDQQLAIGDPRSVPAGRYARQLLRRRGKWDAVQGHLIFTNHVGAALTYARRGEVAAAIVYETDVRGFDSVVILDRKDPAEEPRPKLVAALCTDAVDPATATAFLDFVTSQAGQAILTAHGFGAGL